MVALGVAIGDRLPGEVDARRTVPSTSRTSGSAAGERDRDPPRVEDAGGDLGQQRKVEEVVGGVDQHDLGRAGAAAGTAPAAALNPANPAPTTTTLVMPPMLGQPNFPAERETAG